MIHMGDPSYEARAYPRDTMQHPGDASGEQHADWTEIVPEWQQTTRSGKRIWPHKTRGGRGVVGRLREIDR